jgi:hypothetical protein
MTGTEPLAVFATADQGERRAGLDGVGMGKHVMEEISRVAN